MKTKLLSVFLVLALLLTSVLCVLPISAEVDYDALAKAEGYVCRVGTVEEAAYYDNFKSAVEAADSNGKTVTLIDDTSLTADVVVNNNLTLEGNNKTLTVSGYIRNNGTGTILVKNLTVKTANAMGKELFVLANKANASGALSFVGCTFNITKESTLTDKVFSLNSGNGGFVHLTNCVFSIDKESAFAKADGAAVFAQYNDCTPTVNLDNTPIDISEFSKMVLSKAGNKGLRTSFNIRNQSNITTAMSIKNTKVTVEDSAVVNTATDGNLFDFSSGTEVNFSAKNATLTAQKYVFNIRSCTADVNLSFDGNTTVSSPNRVFCLVSNSKKVSIIAAGNTTLTTDAGEGNLIYANVPADTGFLSFVLCDNAKFISANNGFGFTNSDKKHKIASIMVLNRATVNVTKGTFLDAWNCTLDYVVSDCATVTVPKELANNYAVTQTTLYTPKMVVGASIRIVEGSNGLRFTSTLHNNANFKTYGTLIVKKTELGDTEFTMAALTAANVRFANIVATEAGTVAGDTETTYNAALTNLPEDQFVTDFAARAYVIYTINGEDYIVYSDYKPVGNTRSISDVAEAAKNDISETRTDKHCHEVKDGVWSPYTKAQYELLDGFIKKKS